MYFSVLLRNQQPSTAPQTSNLSFSLGLRNTTKNKELITMLNNNPKFSPYQELRTKRHTICLYSLTHKILWGLATVERKYLTPKGRFSRVFSYLILKANLHFLQCLWSPHYFMYQKSRPMVLGLSYNPFSGFMSIRFHYITKAKTF